MLLPLNPIGAPQPSTLRTIERIGLSCCGVCPM
jgi:hypothetical protein